MGCLIVLAGLFSPRVGTVLLWLFTDRMSRAYDTGIVPILGFVFLPWTTFLYGLAMGGGGSVGAFGIAMIICGFVLDVATLIGAAGERRRRTASSHLV